jgi:hypothetical protein
MLTLSEYQMNRNQEGGSWFIKSFIITPARVQLRCRSGVSVSTASSPRSLSMNIEANAGTTADVHGIKATEGGTVVMKMAM